MLFYFVVLLYCLLIYLLAQEQMSERETQEIVLQGCSLPQDTSHQYARFAPPISDNGR